MRLTNCPYSLWLGPEPALLADAHSTPTPVEYGAPVPPIW